MSRKRSKPETVDESEEEESERQSQSESDEANNQQDGFANTILNLLKQDTGKKPPVLSGRKTTLMKQITEHKTESKSLERKKLEKRRKLEEKIMHSDEINVEFERQLKKLATKGVVALFNCVAKAKKDMHEENKGKTKAKESTVSSDKAFSTSSVIGEKKEGKEGTPKVANAVASKKWSVVDENATEGLLMDWDQEE